MKKCTKALLLVLALVMLFSVVGCTKAADKPGKTEYEDLVIYTNSGAEGRAEWLIEKAKEQGFTIEVVHAGGGDTANRLIAEKNNPIADVVFGLNILQFEDFKAQDMLVEYVPAWVDEVDSTMCDPEGFYHGIVKQAIVLIYNPEVYTEETAPKDWTDLWTNPEYHGKYNLFGLGGGTARTVLSGIAVRYLDPEGELGVSEEGWEQIKQYIQNGYFTGEGEDFVQNLIDKKVPMSMIWGSGVIDKADTYETTFGVMSPEIGVPFVVEQVGIMNGSNKVETAKAFIDWFGSAEVQGAWAQEFGSSPANKVAMENASEEAKALDAKLSKSQEIDWGIVQQSVEQWVEKIELEYME